MLARTHSLPVTRHLLLSLCLCASVVILSGCVRPVEPIRAIWVTRFDYKSADDVTKIVDNCADAGFNTILFQVRGNGTAFYRSNLEPWADELGGTDPGFDPLELACQQAHARGVELHAYVNVMPAWRGTTPPTNPEQLYNKRPEWFWYDQHGNRQALSTFYVSLNPCRPEVREYIVAVFEDIASRYDIDGLHLDYIRFPNEPPAIPARSGLDYPRDEHTLALYQEATGQTPEADQEAWDRWRTEQVTKLVGEIHAMLRRVKPDAVLSASAGSVRANALRHYQDARQWMAEGVMDVVYLMNYTDDPAEFGARIDPWLAENPPVPLVPGLWFGRHRDRSPADAAAAVREQMNIAAEKTGSVCVFSYSGLFDSADEELTEQNARQREVRRVRREILIPALQELPGKKSR